MKKVPPSETMRQSLKSLLCDSKGPKEDNNSILNQIVILGTKLLLQELIEKEQEEYLERSRYSRTGKTNKEYRNGYELGKIRTAEGIVEVFKPQVRGSKTPYRSKIIDSIGKNTPALEKMVVEMYSSGMSVRDIERAMKEATGEFILSDSAVSEITKRLYQDYIEFKNRDLSGYDLAYMFVDSVYEPLRRFNTKKAIMCAWGIKTDGSRVLLGFEQFNSEAAESYKAFFEGLKSRNMKTPMTVTTDGATGLISAVEQSFPRSLRIRCWFHKMQNLEAKVPKSIWPIFKQQVLTVRDATSVESGAEAARKICEMWKKDLPGACNCLMDDLQASLNHIHVIARHRPLVRTTNLVERSFVEQRRRTKVIPHLWSEDSMERLFLFVMKGVEARWERRQFNDVEEKMVIKQREEVLNRNPEFPYTPSINLTAKRAV